MMSTITETKVQKPASPLSVRNFRLLWIGESISLLGDQFYMIALPWLVLQLTGSALALGGVLALAGIPRALFMLIGGALVDRFSPRAVMIVSNLARLVLVALLSALVLTNTIRIEMLYGFALAFGLADAFYFPAQSAITPQLLAEDQLQAGNTFVQGTAQLSLFLGPVLAGGLIALLGHNASADTPSTQGIGIAFGLDTLSFFASLLCLSLMRIPRIATKAAEQQNVIQSIKAGFAYLWSQAALRALFLLMVAMNFFILGPVIVGIPVLAATRLAEGAAAFGIIMSAFGGGALVGIILASALPHLKPERLGAMLLLIISFMGIGLALMPLFTSTPVIAVIMLLIGVTNGYVNINFFTWLQKRVPQELMGRVMSLLIFSSVGLAPISNALAGVILQVNLNVLFIGGGLLMALISLLAILLPAVRQMGLEPTVASPTA
ncbi:MAG: MFS transporter [Chloroflexota bacterium]